MNSLREAASAVLDQYLNEIDISAIRKDLGIDTKPPKEVTGTAAKTASGEVDLNALRKGNRLSRKKLDALIRRALQTDREPRPFGEILKKLDSK